MNVCLDASVNCYVDFHPAWINYSFFIQILLDGIKKNIYQADRSSFAFVKIQQIKIPLIQNQLHAFTLQPLEQTHYYTHKAIASRTQSTAE